MPIKTYGLWYAFFREPSWDPDSPKALWPFRLMSVSDMRGLTVLGLAHENDKSTSWLFVKYCNSPDDRQGDNDY